MNRPRREVELDAQTLLRTIISSVRRHQREVEASAGVPAPQLRLLILLKRRPELTVSEYARELGLSLPTVSNLVHELKDAALISRVRDEHDARRMRLRLTPAGLAMTRVKASYAAGMLPALLGAMSRTELESLVRGLRPLVEDIPLRFKRRKSAPAKTAARSA